MQLLPNALKIGTLAAVIAGTAIAQPAEAVTFQEVDTGVITLFDQSGAQVGGGTFSYRPFRGSFVFPFPIGSAYENPDDPVPPEQNVFRFTPDPDLFLLTSLALTIQANGATIPLPLPIESEFTQTGQPLLAPAYYFWKPVADSVFPSAVEPGKLLTFVPPFRFPFTVRDDEWFGVSNDFSPFSLREDGTWTISSFFGQAGGFVDITGTWRAEAVPEPTTIAGTVLLGGIVALRKRRSVQ